MICPKCSANIPDDSVTCAYCGSPVAAAPEIVEAPVAKVGREEFFKSVCSEKVRKEIKAAIIILYVCAGITLVMELLAGIFPLDALILAGLAFWIQKTKSKASAIVAVAYSAINVIFMLVAAGQFGGWLILVAACGALVYVLKGEKEWQEYSAM